jgi:RTX calcium-binding nonapeptide repeat (4 copies)
VKTFILLSSSPLKKELGMRRTAVLLFSTAVALLFAGGAVLALPSERADETPMVNGTVRAIEQVGTNVWLGGKFTQVKQHKGNVVANVSNVAVFNSKKMQYRNIAPKLGGTDSEVWDMTLYGKNVLIAGTFSGPSSTQKNLVLVRGAGPNAGDVIRWYNSPSLKSALAAPAVGRVYGGGESLTAFELSGKKLWTKAKTTVNTNLYPDAPSPSYRDLELDGQTIWAACACDTVGGRAAKDLVKFDLQGNHDASWRAVADRRSWGMSVAEANGALYLGTGGSDFLGKYDKKAGGARGWRRDTSGSVQVVDVVDGKLVIGGHFWEVADQLGDNCGHRGGGTQELDPNNECKTRKGIAAYSFSGRLDSDWSPTYAGKYSLVWALHVDGARLHTGGEFLTVNGVTQNYYARLSPASIKGDERANTLTGTPNDDAIYGYGGADRIDARDGGDALRLGGGKDKGQGGRGNDYLHAVDGSKDTIYCGPDADRVRANPGDNTAGGCEKVTRAGKRVA